MSESDKEEIEAMTRADDRVYGQVVLQAIAAAKPGWQGESVLRGLAVAIGLEAADLPHGHAAITRAHELAGGTYEESRRRVRELLEKQATRPPLPKSYQR